MTKQTLIYILIFTLLFTLHSCKDKNISFEKTGWNQDKDGIPCPPLREEMLDDLLQNHDLKGLTYKQLIDKLGEPSICETCNDNTLNYEIVVEYNFDIDPVYIKTLEFHYNQDSIITDWKIIEFKH